MSETAELETPKSQQINAEPKLKLPFITSSNAQAIGKLGAQARYAKEAARNKALNDAEAKLTALQPLVEQTVAQVTAIALGSDDEYRLAELMRAREGLAALWLDFKSATDPKERKFLADAIARLSDVEFALAGRPKPGARRPAPEKSAKKESGSGLVED